jgi:molecular chaperone DnaK
MHRFESELDDLRRVVYRAKATLLGMDRAAWDARIEDIMRRAQAAYDANDAPAWRRIYNEVLALYETASQEEFAAVRIDDPGYVTRRLAGVLHYANRIEASLVDFVPSAADEVRVMQLAERDRLLGVLRDKVMSPLGSLKVDDSTDSSAVRRKLEQIASELNRIESALERIPSLGLVTERGGP